MELKKIIKTANRRVRYFRIYTLKNRLPLKYNALHLSYGVINRFKNRNANYELFPSSNEIADGINKNGFHIAKQIIPADKLQAIKARIDKVYQSREGVDDTRLHAGLMTINNGLVSVPECQEVLELPEIKAALHRFYGGNYRLFHLNIYRTLPKEVQESTGSDKWHFDNVTSNQLKLMFYLVDVKADTGAMQVVDKANSHRLRKNGFVSRNRVAEYEEDIKSCAIPLEAPAGSVAFFQPQHCIHRATEPQRELRDVMVLMVYPHIEQLPIDDKMKAEICAKKSLLLNPYDWSKFE